MTRVHHPLRRTVAERCAARYGWDGEAAYAAVDDVLARGQDSPWGPEVAAVVAEIWEPMWRDIAKALQPFFDAAAELLRQFAAAVAPIVTWLARCAEAAEAAEAEQRREEARRRRAVVLRTFGVREGQLRDDAGGDAEEAAGVSDGLDAGDEAVPSGAAEFVEADAGADSQVAGPAEIPD